MSKNLIQKYVWIVDTISRHTGITRRRLDTLWQRTSLSEGKPLAERTFFFYRREIEELFNITVRCRGNGEYYIDGGNRRGSKKLTDWMLDSFAVNSALSDSSASTADRVQVEDVPSAREFLPTLLEAMRDNHRVVLSYAGFNRSRTEHNILFAPWFLKRYKQRWYVIGVKGKNPATDEGTQPGLRDVNGQIRTYALDRVRSMIITDEKFVMPRDADPDLFFGSIIGITSSKAEVRDVRIRADRTQAKYLRALPMHESQSEELHDEYSIFSYKLKLNYELVHEIIGLGPSVTVLEPRELRMMVIDELTRTLENYQM